MGIENRAGSALYIRLPNKKENIMFAGEYVRAVAERK